MAAPRILFCVGATKAGTSWLHEWLSDHPDCLLRSVKEVHYFNTFEDGAEAKRRMELSDLRDAMIARKAADDRVRDVSECLSLFEGGPDGQAYLDYLNGGRQGEAVVGDVTPAYGLLPVARLKMMAGLGDTRFLYILRDPVARLWSHVRMIASRREPDGSVTEERAGRILKRTLRGDEDHIVRRGDYRGVMERLTRAVPEMHRLFVFFEDLVSGDAADRICAFLGIASRPPLAQVVHAGDPVPMTEAQARAARDFLSDQYDYVETAMGRVPEAWRLTERATR